MSKELAEAGKLVVQAGGAGAGVYLAVGGATATAVSAATVIAATGGAAAVVLAGYGVYRWLSSDNKKGT